MNRRGQALDIMNFLLFIAALVIWTQMFISPSAFNQGVGVQVNDYDPLVKSSMLEYFLEEEYINQSLNDSVYRGLYRHGQGTGVWAPHDIDSEADIRDDYSAAVSSTFATDYLGTIAGGGGCAVNGVGGIVAEPVGEDGSTMEFETEEGGQPRADCVSIRQLAAGDRLVRSLRSIGFLDIPAAFTTDNVRYLKMSRLARAVAEADTFRETIEDTVDRSSNYAWAEGSEQARNCDPYAEDGETCPFLSRYVDYPELEDVRDYLENEQEQKLIDTVDIRAEIQDAADTAADDFTAGNPEYNGLEVTIEVTEMEYRLGEGTVVQEDWKIASCGQSCFRENCEGPKSCSACGCSVSCDPPEPEPCPPTVCAETPYTTTPPSRGGDMWTDDPWTLEITEPRYSDPLPGPDIDWGNDTLQFARAPVAADTRPLDVAWRGAPATRLVQDDGDSCEGDSCSETCASTSANNLVDQLTRRVWEFDQVQSFMRVKINITDTGNRIPTRDGFKHPVFVVHYDQISTESFS